MSVITGDQISYFQFLARMKALEMELLGMERRGRSAYSIIKEAYGYTGTRKSVLKQMKSDRLEWD